MVTKPKGKQTHHVQSARPGRKIPMALPAYKGLSPAELYQQALQANVVKSAVSNERIVSQTPSLQRLAVLLKRPIP